MIQLNSVSKYYQMGEVEVRALDDVTLNIAKGQFIAIMGASGSGKSTLMNVLGLLDLPITGEYLLENTDISELADNEVSRIRNQHYGFVFQSYNLFPELTALENVALPLMYAKKPSKERRERAAALLSKVQMDHRMNHFPAQLSGGEQQRVAVARALVNEPSLLLADEPTGNLSSGHEEEIMQLFAALNDEGATIVMVTHSAAVAGYAKDLILISDGRIVSETPITQRFRPVEIANMQGGYLK